MSSSATADIRNISTEDTSPVETAEACPVSRDDISSFRRSDISAVSTHQKSLLFKYHNFKVVSTTTAGNIKVYADNNLIIDYTSSSIMGLEGSAGMWRAWTSDLRMQNFQYSVNAPGQGATSEGECKDCPKATTAQVTAELIVLFALQDTMPMSLL